MTTETEVCIVGAGPVGLLTALRLGQAGVRTILLEAHGSLLKTTRACVYGELAVLVNQIDCCR
jgi:2-polyprenyl-6-methoxyphenol hydroxylase-like FAD-dependent oxidoreductase